MFPQLTPISNGIVLAGAFFSNNADVGSVLQTNTSAVNVSTRSSLRSKADILDATCSVQTRRRSQRFPAIENTTDDSNRLVGAVMSPATSSGVASKREATRFPSVIFRKTPAATQMDISSPLPGPKSATSSYVSTKRTARKEEEEESAASESTTQQLPQFNRTTVASELYQSATSQLSTSTDDLSSLQNTLKALKSSSLSTNTTKHAVIPATTVAPTPAPAYVPLPKPASRRPSARPLESSSLDSLQQRVARMNMSNLPASLHKKAAVASPKIERYSPVGVKAVRAATPAKQQQQILEENSHTPPMRCLPEAPGAPANTPASPLSRTLAETQQLRQQYDTDKCNGSGPPPAQIEAALAAKYQLNEEEKKDEKPAVEVTAPITAAAPLDLQNLPSEEAIVLMASPLPTMPNITATTAPVTTCARTKYDGDKDVIMGDIGTPGTGAGSIDAMATTVPRRASFNADSNNNENNSNHSSGGGANGSDNRSTGSGVRSSSRFKIEALRQGVTPLRVRQHRASFSPSNAGVNVEIESAMKAVAPVGNAVAVNEKKTQEKVASFAVSSNPLALHPVLPAAVSRQNSPAVSSDSAISNNPLFAGTPSHPTPPSITTRRPSLGMAATAGLRTPSTGGASAASEGIKLAEKLYATAEKLQTPVTAVTSTGNKKNISAAFNNTSNSDEDATFQFKGDVQALLQALDANTPQQESNTKPSTRALAAASTEERPKPVARRRSSLTATPNSGGAAILDLAGFDKDGERTAPGQETPLLARRGGTESTTMLINASSSHHTTHLCPPREIVTRSSPCAGELAAASHPSSVPAPVVASLRQQIDDLESERKDAASLLSGYQGTIAELQDRHSLAIIKLQAENAMLKSESERLRSDRAQIHSQFDTLYREKYAPLKTEAAALRRGADALRTRLAEEGGHVKRIAQLEAELSASKAATAAAQQGTAALKAEAEAAKESERVAEQRACGAGARLQELETKWATKFAAESSKAEQALVRKEGEVSAWKDKHTAMARQHDDAVHRAHLAQAGRERKAAEVAQKEEEICALQVRLQEYESVLRQYRAENEKFAASKETYKARIAALEKELVGKEAEKQSLAALVDELLQKKGY